jgi:light-regulated signal transduction histidine kinase (bacteriophytochrome)
VLNYSTLNSTQEESLRTNLNEIFKNIESDLEVLINEKKATINIQNNLPELEGAPILLYQLFYNIINNSLKFTRADVAPVITVSASTSNASGSAVISISDNGIGFDPAYATRIFDTFSRLNAKDQFEGTGIGLAVCQKIVTRHHGTISAHAKENEGATFLITLPLTQSTTTI